MTDYKYLEGSRAREKKAREVEDTILPKVASSSNSPSTQAELVAAARFEFSSFDTFLAIPSLYLSCHVSCVSLPWAKQRW
jgi:hypothetical protein